MRLMFLVPGVALGDATNVAMGDEYGRRSFENKRRDQLLSIVIMGGYMGLAMVAGVFLWDDLHSLFNDREEIAKI